MGFFDTLWTAGKDVRDKFAGMSYSVKQSEARAIPASDLEEENVDHTIERNIEKLTVLVNNLDEMRENVSKCCKDYVELKLIRNEVANKTIFGPPIPVDLLEESRNLLAIGDFLENKKTVDVSAVNKALADRQRKLNLRKRKLTETPRGKHQKEAEVTSKNNNDDEEALASKKAKKDEDFVDAIENVNEDEDVFSDVNLDI